MFHGKVPLGDANGNIVKWYGSSLDIDERKTADEQLRRNAEELQRGEFSQIKFQNRWDVSFVLLYLCSFDSRSKCALSRQRIAVTRVMQHRDGHHMQKNSACWADGSLLQFRSRLQQL